MTLLQKEKLEKLKQKKVNQMIKILIKNTPQSRKKHLKATNCKQLKERSKNKIKKYCNKNSNK